MPAPSLILASTSSYRKELLARLKVDFTCVDPQVDEDSYKHQITDPGNLALTLAIAKAEAVAQKYPQFIIIGSDQLVSFEGQILGKPITPERAVKQLLSLSGKTHSLITAVCLIHQQQKLTFIDEPQLSLRALTPEEADRYVSHDSPLNCACSYKIEALGISLFDDIKTSDFTAITGLPLIKLSAALRQLGLSIP